MREAKLSLVGCLRVAQRERTPDDNIRQQGDKSERVSRATCTDCMVAHNGRLATFLREWHVIYARKLHVQIALLRTMGE